MDWPRTLSGRVHSARWMECGLRHTGGEQGCGWDCRKVTVQGWSLGHSPNTLPTHACLQNWCLSRGHVGSGSRIFPELQPHAVSAPQSQPCLSCTQTLLTGPCGSIQFTWLSMAFQKGSQASLVGDHTCLFCQTPLAVGVGADGPQGSSVAPFPHCAGSALPSFVPPSQACNSSPELLMWPKMWSSELQPSLLK